MKLRAAKKTTRHEEGFTILETCVALVVMMIVGMGAIGGFLFAIRYNSASADRAASMSVAQTTIEKFRAMSFTDAALNAGTTTATVSDVTGRQFTVTTTVANKTVVSGKTTVKSITVQVVPNAPIIPIDQATYSSGYEYYGSVKLLTERSNPLVGTNIN